MDHHEAAAADARRLRLYDVEHEQRHGSGIDGITPLRQHPRRRFRRPRIGCRDEAAGPAGCRRYHADCPVPTVLAGGVAMGTALLTHAETEMDAATMTMVSKR